MTNQIKTKPGSSRTATLLPESKVESMRKRTKDNHQRAQEILAGTVQPTPSRPATLLSMGNVRIRKLNA
jgi:hypothetical protein